MTLKQGDAIGYAAMLLTTAAPIFQVLKTYTTGSTTDLSLPMWIVQMVGCAIWIIYAVEKKQGPILVANALTGLAAVAVLIALFVFPS